MARITIHSEVIVNDKVEEAKVKISTLKKITTDKVENRRILAYSLKKINTKPIDAYSMLNPDTSSDSPSAKSKGVRLVSASSSTNQIANERGMTLKQHIGPLTGSFSLKFINKVINSITTKASLIS